MMKTRVPFFLTLIALVAILLSACGAAATRASAPATAAPATAAPAMDVYAPAEQKSAAGGAPLALPTAGPVMDNGVQAAGAPAFDRMIIKNADIKLEVADTNIAIDRTTQLVGDLGGYIISSRVWVQAYYEFNLKYATLTIGLPVDQFERALTRLRALSIKVLDETASGEDVTNQFVDLQSQMTNLEATRDRIKSFLDQANTVDEALRINQQLSDIEGQIEKIKGQMNYLKDRSAYSTITINFEPQLPEIASTPTPTPTPTSTPSAWNPGKTFTSATKTVTSAYQGIIEFLIWFFVVIVPILLPPFLIVWGLWKLLRRKPK
jgi:hypothetical protein